MKIKQAKQSNQHAVVIGASMAGLLAARVLSEHFEQVTIVNAALLEFLKDLTPLG